MATQDAEVRIYRPRALIGALGYFSVIIDERDRGELWPNQVRTFNVHSGDHQIQLRQGVITKTSPLKFSVESQQRVDFACSRLRTVAGLVGLHPASPKESEKMQMLIPHPPEPRNLASPD
jgi:hypothetical protein